MIFSKIKSALVVGVVGVATLTSCGPDQVGPDLVSASGDFKKDIELDLIFGGISSPKVDFFQDDNSHFESTNFSEKVSWNLYVKGLSSGAQVNFSGLSDKIDNTNSLWQYGKTSTVQFFQSGEKFVGELHIAGLDTVFTSDTLHFSNDYNWNLRTINGVKHVVLETFELNQNAQGLAATSPDANDNNVVISVSDVKRVSGRKSLEMKGEDANGNGWLGDINHERLVELSAANDVASLPIDSGVNPDDLYLNIYVYGDPSFSNTAVEIKVYENDAPEMINRDTLLNFANDAAQLLTADYQAVSDAWIYDIQVNWEGWKLVSIPYSSFRAANSLTKGGGGNRIKESWRITAVAVSILSFPTSGKEVGTYVDFLTMSQYGKPQY